MRGEDWRRHCRLEGCLCTHTDPCDHGWVDMPEQTVHGIVYRAVAPCPICRPEAAGRLAASLERTSRSVPA